MARTAARGRRGAQPASRVAGRDRRRVSALAVALRKLPAAHDGRQPGRPAACATGGLSRGREGVRGLHRRAHGALAAAAAGALHAQPGAGRGGLVGGHVRSHRGGARGSPTTTTPGKCGRRPAAIRRNRPPPELPTVRISGEEMWTRHAPHPPAPPPAQPQAAAAPVRVEAAQEGEVSGRVGQPVERHGHLLLPARGPGDRRLRPLPEEEGQEHPLGRARARRAVHHLDPGRHRHARDHPQLVRGTDLRPPVPEDPAARWARWW